MEEGLDELSNKFNKNSANHSSGAQELVLRYMNEENIDIACISEPWRVPGQNCKWYGSMSRAAILRAIRGKSVKNCILRGLVGCRDR